MDAQGIQFHSEDVDSPNLPYDRIGAWLLLIIDGASRNLTELTYIFCSDEYLLDINRQYLDHDYYTDIITFDQSDDDRELSGDIFISVDRVKDNSTELKVSLEKEFLRVIVHGVLHLLGYNDQGLEEKEEMRALENHYLQKFYQDN